MDKLVSVLIPCFNAEAWIQSAVRSALAQTWPRTEVIVVDDGSSDRSVHELQTFADEVRVVSRENRGGNATRNELLSLAQGQWIQYLDADDELLPDKIERQMEVVARTPAADVIYSPLIIEHHGAGDPRRETWAPHRSQGPHDPWEYHLAWKLTQTGGALFRADALRRIGGWNETQRCCQDNELFFRLLREDAVFEHCSHAGALYRRFEHGSVSTERQDRVRCEILRLLDLGEAFLRERGQLTPERLAAMNENRFGLARQLWPTHRDLSRQAIEAVRRSMPEFRPAIGPHAPPTYRRLYAWFGFETAERLAQWKRGVGSWF